MTALPSPASVVPATVLPPLRADATTVDALHVSSGGGGLVLGRDRDGGTVRLALFRPEPTVALAVAPLSLVQVLVVRSLALGAQVVVQTTRPAAWSTFAQLAAGRTGSVSVVDQPGTLRPGTLAVPQLLVVDDEAGGGDPHRVGAWATQLTLVESMSRWNAAGVGNADVVLTQGLGLSSAQVVGRAMGLPDPEAALAGLPGDVVTLVSRAVARSVQVVPTSVEQWLLQAAARR